LVGCAGPQTPQIPQRPGDKTSAQANEQHATANDEKGLASSNNKKTSETPNPTPPRATRQTIAKQPAPTPPLATQSAKSEQSEGRIVAVTPNGSEIRRVGPEPQIPLPSLAPSEEELARRREQASDLVYALIRVRMEEAIIHRKELLEAGRPRSDVKVRRLEGVIMNARQYLVNDGEVVEAVDPPIVQMVRPK